MIEKNLDNSSACDTITLKDVRCLCGKLLGKVQEGAAHEHKCPRCKMVLAYKNTVDLIKAEEKRRSVFVDSFRNVMRTNTKGEVVFIKKPARF